MVAIGKASRLSGVSVETIRYYEREGVVARAGRTDAGRRDFSDRGIAELRFIKRCRDLGFSVRDAVALRQLSRDRAGACGTAEALGRQHLASLRAKIEDLKGLESALAELVANCTEGRKDCPMLDRLMGQIP